MSDREGGQTDDVVTASEVARSAESELQQGVQAAPSVSDTVDGISGLLGHVEISTPPRSQATGDTAVAHVSDERSTPPAAASAVGEQDQASAGGSDQGSTETTTSDTADKSTGAKSKTVKSKKSVLKQSLVKQMDKVRRSLRGVKGGVSQRGAYRVSSETVSLDSMSDSDRDDPANVSDAHVGDVSTNVAAAAAVSTAVTNPPVAQEQIVRPKEPRSSKTKKVASRKETPMEVDLEQMQCSFCFGYPAGRGRRALPSHWARHSANCQLYHIWLCPVAGCYASVVRPDNLTRHIEKVHGYEREEVSDLGDEVTTLAVRRLIVSMDDHGKPIYSIGPVEPEYRSAWRKRELCQKWLDTHPGSLTPYSELSGESKVRAVLKAASLAFGDFPDLKPPDEKSAGKGAAKPAKTSAVAAGSGSVPPREVAPKPTAAGRESRPTQRQPQSSRKRMASRSISSHEEGEKTGRKGRKQQKAKVEPKQDEQGAGALVKTPATGGNSMPPPAAIPIPPIPSCSQAVVKAPDTPRGFSLFTTFAAMRALREEAAGTSSEAQTPGAKEALEEVWSTEEGFNWAAAYCDYLQATALATSAEASSASVSASASAEKSSSATSSVSFASVAASPAKPQPKPQAEKPEAWTKVEPRLVREVARTRVKVEESVAPPELRTQMNALLDKPTWGSLNRVRKQLRSMTEGIQSMFDRLSRGLSDPKAEQPETSKTSKQPSSSRGRGAKRSGRGRGTPEERTSRSPSKEALRRPGKATLGDALEAAKHVTPKTPKAKAVPPAAASRPDQLEERSRDRSRSPRTTFKRVPALGSREASPLLVGNEHDRSESRSSETGEVSRGAPVSPVVKSKNIHDAATEARDLEERVRRENEAEDRELSRRLAQSRTAPGEQWSGSKDPGSHWTPGPTKYHPLRKKDWEKQQAATTQSRADPAPETRASSSTGQKVSLLTLREILDSAKEKERKREAEASVKSRDYAEHFPPLSPSNPPSVKPSQPTAMEVDGDGEQKTDTGAPQPCAVVTTEPSLPPGFQQSTASWASVALPGRDFVESEAWGRVSSRVPITPLSGVFGTRSGDRRAYLSAGSIVGIQAGAAESNSGGMRYVRIDRPSYLRISPVAHEQTAQGDLFIHPPRTSRPGRSEPQPRTSDHGPGDVPSQDTASRASSTTSVLATSDTSVVSSAEPAQESKDTRL